MTIAIYSLPLFTSFSLVDGLHATHSVSLGSTDKTSMTEPKYVQPRTLDWTLSLMIGTRLRNEKPRG